MPRPICPHLGACALSYECSHRAVDRTCETNRGLGRRSGSSGGRTGGAKRPSLIRGRAGGIARRDFPVDSTSVRRHAVVDELRQLVRDVEIERKRIAHPAQGHCAAAGPCSGRLQNGCGDGGCALGALGLGIDCGALVIRPATSRFGASPGGPPGRSRFRTPDRGSLDAARRCALGKNSGNHARLLDLNASLVALRRGSWGVELRPL